VAGSPFEADETVNADDWFAVETEHDEFTLKKLWESSETGDTFVFDQFDGADEN